MGPAYKLTDFEIPEKKWRGLSMMTLWMAWTSFWDAGERIHWLVENEGWERVYERKGWDFWVGRMSGKLCCLTEIRNMKRQHIFRGRMSSNFGCTQLAFLKGIQAARPGPGFVVLEVMSMGEDAQGHGGMSWWERMKRKEAQNKGCILRNTHLRDR